MKRKIYIRIKGGLGNQLFQFAFALHLQKRGFEVDGLWVDHSKDNYGHSFLLDTVLTTSPHVATELAAGTVLVQSESDEAIAEYLHRHPDTSVLLEGYFQNIHYLQDSGLEHHLQSPLRRYPIAAVHVRRGEYGHHGILPFSYYTQALSMLGSPEFMVYSDEPNYAEYMFAKIAGYRGTVRPNLDQPSNEFLQLTTHSSLVMANSSFSWLAAFLAFKRTGATILYPSEWTLMSIAPGHDPTWRSVNTQLIRP